MCLVLALFVLMGAHALEQQCINYAPNRFEYEKNVIEKLTYLEQFKAEMTGKVAALEKQVTDTNEALKSTVRKQNGLTYVRWGRKTCPNITTTSLVYTGQAASCHHRNSGRAEYLCLPNDPQFDAIDSTEHGAARSNIYGAEYETPNTAFTTLNTMEVPCALCLSRGKTTVMLPARTSCYNGWTLEYRGYFMSSEINHPGKNYVCMDINAEALDASHGNLDEALFYLVEGRCSALKCPPYVNGQELTCAVCSITL